MKRFLLILMTLSIVFSFLFVSVSAVNDEAGNQANDYYKNGELYGKIINWQNYVTSSTEVNGLWDTVVVLPKHSLWELHDGGGAYGRITYTNLSQQRFYLEQRDNVVLWSTPYYLSLEDINSIDPTVFDFTLATDLPMAYVTITVSLYDQYMSFVKDINTSYGRNQLEYNYTYLRSGAIQWNGGIGWEGAKYVKFSVEIHFQEILEPTWVVLSNIDWTISLPFEYDPLRYPVDGTDAWMNGYFVPTIPEVDKWWEADGEALSQVISGAGAFSLLLSSLPDILVSLNVPLFVMRSIFNSIIGISWVGNILTVSATVGLFGFLLSMARNVSAKAERSSRKK